MTDKYPPAVQRPALLKLVEALGCRDAALRRDECGDWRINGKHGYIYAVPGIPWGGMEKVEGFQIYFRGAAEFEEPTSSQAWTWARKTLEPFCRVTQDGDMEGMLFLARLPTPEEAEIIRDKLRIAKRAEFSEEVLAQKREGMQKARESLGRRPENGGSEG
jgi:hypothetical protein